MEQLFGLETEYALAALDTTGGVINRSDATIRLMQIAEARLPHLCDGTMSGFFLQNGARLYVDWGYHPEFATPECSNPWDAVRYLHAGEYLLAELAAELEKLPGVGETLVLRTNVDYGGTAATWGTHESYMYRNPRPDLAEQIIPHLVSRIVYTGAGGFDNLCSSELKFTLSPRVWHLQRDISDESTQHRGIFHTKNEALASAGYNRLHILCGESLCSEIANWLKVGVTALVVALIDASRCPGDAVTLTDPLKAMRDFAGDTTCRATVPLHDGSLATAIQIQRHYLGLAEDCLGQPFMPPFAESVCREWRAMLERLEQAPESVATCLDWAIKFALYKDRARKRGMDWNVVESWNVVVRRLLEVLGHKTLDFPIEVLLGTSRSAPSLKRRLAGTLRARGLVWDDLVPFLRFRDELREIDARFGRLGEGGIFTTLDGAGVLTHRVPGVDNIAQAMENPPAVGRPQLRGELVRRLAGEGHRYLCDWRWVWDRTERRRIDMSDPFAPASDWSVYNRDDEEGLFVRGHAPIRFAGRRRRDAGG